MNHSFRAPNTEMKKTPRAKPCVLRKRTVKAIGVFSLHLWTNIVQLFKKPFFFHVVAENHG